MPLRVVAVYLLPRFADLLDDQEACVTLNDALDLGLVVSRDHDEVVALTHDRLVSGGRKLERLDTGGTAALAVEGLGS
jgi:hypothetical protein